MSEPISESKEKKSAREKGMEAWAASIAARQQQPSPLALPEQESSSGGPPKTNTSQRPQDIKTVTDVQKNHVTTKQDTVDLARRSEKSTPELTMKDMRELAKGRSTPKPVSPQPTPQLQTPILTTPVEKSMKETLHEVVVKSAEVVTVEDIQLSPGVASTVAASGVKGAQKAEKTESKTEIKASEETDEEEEVLSLIEPGNSPKARAYVRAGDFKPDNFSDPDIDDYVLAL